MPVLYLLRAPIAPRKEPAVKAVNRVGSLVLQAGGNGKYRPPLLYC